MLLKKLVQLKKVVEICNNCDAKHGCYRNGFCFNVPISEKEILEVLDELIFYKRCEKLHGLEHFFERYGENNESKS